MLNFKSLAEVSLEIQQIAETRNSGSEELKMTSKRRQCDQKDYCNHKPSNTPLFIFC